MDMRLKREKEKENENENEISTMYTNIKYHGTWLESESAENSTHCSLLPLLHPERKNGAKE